MHIPFCHVAYLKLIEISTQRGPSYPFQAIFLSKRKSRRCTVASSKKLASTAAYRGCFC